MWIFRPVPRLRSARPTRFGGRRRRLARASSACQKRRVLRGAAAGLASEARKLIRALPPAMTDAMAVGSLAALGGCFDPQ